MSTETSIDHYASIVAVLLAGDIQARVATNGAHSTIVVTADGDRIIWGNTTGRWAFTVVTKEGTTVGGSTDVAAGVPPEEAAVLISKGVVH